MMISQIIKGKEALKIRDNSIIKKMKRKAKCPMQMKNLI